MKTRHVDNTVRSLEAIDGALVCPALQVEHFKRTVIFRGKEQPVAGQVDAKMVEISAGKSLMFHPDFIAGTPLATRMANYHFLAYETAEALHLSENEETIIDDIIASLDKHSGRVFETPGFTVVLDRAKLILAKKDHQTPDPVIIKKTDREINYGSYKLTLLHDDSPLIVKNNAMF